MSSEKSSLRLPEDWTVVVLGFLIIFISIAGVILRAPAFGWKTSDDLFQTVLAADNLLLITKQFFFVLVVAVVGA